MLKYGSRLIHALPTELKLTRDSNGNLQLMTRVEELLGVPGAFHLLNEVLSQAGNSSLTVQ